MACGGMIHKPRAAEQTGHLLNWSDLIQHLIQVLLLLFFIFSCFMTWSKAKKEQEDSICEVFFFTQNRPLGNFAALCGALQSSSCRQRGQQELAAGLNSATIDYHSIRFRLGSTASGRNAAGEEKEEWIPNTHKPVLIAEMLPRQKW